MAGDRERMEIDDSQPQDSDSKISLEVASRKLLSSTGKAGEGGVVSVAEGGLVHALSPSRFEPAFRRAEAAGLQRPVGEFLSRVLIIDDELSTQLLISKRLQVAGHDPLMESNPRRALEIAAEQAPDAVILDVVMPDLSGWEVLEALRAMPSMAAKPILMVSGTGDAKVRAQGIRLGADDFLTKPFDVDELLARLEALLARRWGRSSSLQGRLESHPLAEVAQTLEHLSSRGRLTVISGPRSGWLEISGQFLLGAEFGRLTGGEAFLSMLELEEGDFAFSPVVPASKAPVTEGAIKLSSLLLEAAWIEDELRSRRGLLPAPGSRLRLLTSPRAAPGDLPDLPLQEILRCLEDPKGRYVGALVVAVKAAPRRTLLGLTWLLGNGCLVAEETLGAESAMAPATVGEAWRPAPAPRASVTASTDEIEAVESAVRDLLQVATLSGVSLEPLRVTLLVEPGAWDEVARVLLLAHLELPGSIESGEAERIVAQQGGELQLNTEAARLAVSVEPWPEASSRPIATEHRWGVVVAWSAGKLLEASCLFALEAFTANIPDRVGRLIICRPGEPAGESWTPVPPPVSFRQLLEALARAWD